MSLIFRLLAKNATIFQRAQTTLLAKKMIINVTQELQNDLDKISEAQKAGPEKARISTIEDAIMISFALNDRGFLPDIMKARAGIDLAFRLDQARVAAIAAWLSQMAKRHCFITSPNTAP